MGSVGDIWVNIGMKSTMDRDTGKVQGAMAKLSGTVKQHGMIIGGAMTGMGAAMLMAGEKVDKAYASIISGTGATGKALEDLKGSFHDVYGTIPADAKVVGDALATLNTLTGATGDTLEDLTVNIAEVSRMLGEDAAANAESFGQAMKQWQVPAEEGTVLMDKLYKICQDTNIGFGNLTTSLNKYGAVMLNAGFSIEETAQMMGKMHSAGMQISRIMPGLNAAFRRWAKEGKDARLELEKTINLISKVKTNMEALTIATDAFGAEGAQRLVTSVRNGTFVLEELDVGLDNTKGLIMETAKETLTFSDRFAMLTNRAIELLAPFQGIGAVLTFIGPLIVATNAAMSLSAASAGAGTIAYAQYAIAELGVAAATKVLTVALLTNPLFWIPAVVAGAVAALYILEKKFGTLSDIGRGLNVILGGITNSLKTLSERGRTYLDIVIERTSTWLTKLTGVNQEIIDTTLNWAKLAAIDMIKGIVAGPALYGIIKLGENAEMTAEQIVDAKEKIKASWREVADASVNVERATAQATKAEEAYTIAVTKHNKESKEAKTAALDLRDARLTQSDAVDNLNTKQGDHNRLIEEGSEEYKVYEQEAKKAYDTITAAPDTLSTTFELETPSISEFIAAMDMVETKASLTERAIAVMGNPAMLLDYENVLLDIVMAQDDLNASTKRTGELSSEVMQLVNTYNDLENTIKRISDLSESMSDQERSIKSTELAAAKAKTAFADMMSAAGLSASQISSILADVSEEGELNNDLYERLGETSQRTGTDLQSAYLSALGAADSYSDAQRRGIELAKEEEAAKKHAAEVETRYGGLEEQSANIKTKKAELETALDAEDIIRDEHRELQVQKTALQMNAEITEYERFRTWLTNNPGEAEIIIKRYETTGAGMTTTPISSGEISAGNIAATNIYGAPPTPGSFTAAIANVSGAATPTNVTVTVNAEIHNYSDVMDLQDKIAQAKQMGVHNALGIR